jgi:hypothetical protein
MPLYTLQLKKVKNDNNSIDPQHGISKYGPPFTAQMARAMEAV